jgi:hypothetical protein
LERQHPGLRRAIEQSAARVAAARDAAAVAAIVPDWRAFLTDLARHEADEDRLLQQACGGAADTRDEH